MRLTPYELEDRLLVDVQQIIPLTEAATYQTQVRGRKGLSVPVKGVEISLGSALNWEARSFLSCRRLFTHSTQPWPATWSIRRYIPEQVVEAIAY